MARAWFWTACGVTLIGSFFITMWITQPETPPDKALAMLERATIVDPPSLVSAANDAGLRTSPVLEGRIDVINRIDASTISIAGWVVLRNSKGEPITVLAFANGKKIFRTETKGERPDVTNTLHLNEVAASNVAFTGTLPCSPGQKLIVVAVTLQKLYLGFDPVTCP